MKRPVLIVFLTLLTCTISAQSYNTEKLKTIAKIWGECYLFHPSIVRADREVNWEKQLLDFLPGVKQVTSDSSFIENINSNLLSALQDPYTRIQPYPYHYEKLASDIRDRNNAFDYLRVSEKELSDINGVYYLYSSIKNKTTAKPLVLDCRIDSELKLDWHAYTPFEYFASMFIDNNIPLCQSVSREHFGWDEYNDWWFYEQRWRIAQDDKQQKHNGQLLPFLSYKRNLKDNSTGFNFESFVTIERPVYFIVNRSFLSYYHSLLQSLQDGRSNISVIFEDAGEVFTGQQGLKRYKLKYFEFILNTSFYYNSGSTDLDYDLVNSADLEDCIFTILQSNQKLPDNNSLVTFQISPRKYTSTGPELSMEEKILGIIKIYTIVKYFYPYLDNCSIDWENILDKYLEMVQDRHSDKEYYFLIQEMMAGLNDSHVSTFHPSILDFSQIFVAPVQFEWIENKVVVTTIDSSVKADINIGDEILSINNRTIDNILEKEARSISSSNNQGLLSTVINTSYFTGAYASVVKFELKNKGKQKIVEIPRSINAFQFIGSGDSRQESAVLDNEIGYLNLAALTNSSRLESELLRMRNTKSLILDLRDSYPTADYHKFLQMLCQQTVITRQSEVPVVSASYTEVRQFEASKISPSLAFSYDKPIAVLIDKTMISRPEDLAIALKSYPNVITVGEQTQGSDGELTKIYLPGGGETSFTGQIIRFGNGEAFQRKGIIPDIQVERTVDGVINKRDEILEKAIEILSIKLLK